MSDSKRRAKLLFFLLVIQLLFLSVAKAAEVGDTKPCEGGSCSKDGFHETAEDYHSKTHVRRPSCSVSAEQPMRRVVGYYEGWAPARSCQRFMPSQVPDGVYTHINFAFALMNPKTFEIRPSLQSDSELYEQLAEKKHVDPSLKVFIAIGGWAINDAAGTTTIFSGMAHSLTKQKVFIASVINFMHKYDFDGVDLHWQYPTAPDWQGGSEDFENLPKFLANLKTAMRQSGSRDGLSLAIPASQWYLQHLNVKRIAKHVDFFNLMSYDLHSPLNTPQRSLGNQLKSHTNLTEIKSSLDLLWSNNIDPDQVNMGLAFYARTYIASSPDCLSPGCSFDSGGEQGRCTRTVGVLSNSEIHNGLARRRSSIVALDKEAAVKILTSRRQWLTYDDGETWKLKLDFARSQCLGGAMVWAVSQDTADGKYSKELQSVTGYRSNQITALDDDVIEDNSFGRESPKFEASVDLIQEQCRWSNCGKACPSYWKAVIRHDENRLSSRERMVDDTGCGGLGARTFCCPPGKQPQCEWQQFNRGKCTPGCKGVDPYEVASTSLGCNNGKAQVACCSGDTPALDAYRRCSWKGKEPECGTKDSGTSCDWSASMGLKHLLVSSMDGSGDQQCWQQDGQDAPVERITKPREYCCKDHSENASQWTNCGWYYKGFSSLATSKATGCDASCPEGMIKLALQTNGCESGKQAFCCNANVTRPQNNAFQDFEDALRAWVKNPTCPIPNRRHNSGFSTARMVVVPGLSEILREKPDSVYTKRIREIWDELVLPRWRNMKARKLSSRLGNGGYDEYH